MITNVNLSDISKSIFLRLGARYTNYWKNLNGKIFNFNYRQIELKQFVKIVKIKNVKKGDLTKEYQLIDLANIEPGIGFLNDLDKNIVSEIGSDKIILDGADIVFSRLNSHIGYVFLMEDIPNSKISVIGSTEFFPLKVDNTTIPSKLLKYYLLHREFRKKAIFIRTGKSQSHPRIQVEDFMRFKFPILPQKVSIELIRKINIFEDEIKKKKLEYESLQNIIESVFLKYDIKKPSLDENFHIKIKPMLSNIANQRYMRIGAEYMSFWMLRKGCLFQSEDKNKYPIIPMKRLIRKYNATVIKKGLMTDTRILVEFEHIQSLNGKIENLSNVVTEVGSDKIEFGNADFLTNKLRPYLGYTIINPKHLNIIGTTEFIPFSIINKLNTSVNYIRYVFLSSEYLKQSKLLMSGKEHPRINISDILNIRIPLPKLTIQHNIVKEILQRELKSAKILKEIKVIREKIDNIILDTLNYTKIIKEK
ncbi:restriction endonuclease subunit S [Clostridium kluyveri]|uniref:Type I specificity subunit-related protein n=2 Tax=Clostridium kluyveri TaxID=1534 RepID=A5N1F2_CLOK5|nr:restriction endonuclease subunit S [Clostridium kluyveri]EDK34948.1 Type I specificity subunit-related protein [Clostridium kluyveri DSM 555]